MGCDVELALLLVGGVEAVVVVAVVAAALALPQRLRSLGKLAVVSLDPLLAGAAAALALSTKPCSLGNRLMLLAVLLLDVVFVEVVVAGADDGSLLAVAGADALSTKL